MFSASPLRLGAPDASERLFAKVGALGEDLQLMGSVPALGTGAIDRSAAGGDDARRDLHAIGFVPLPRQCSASVSSSLVTMIGRLVDAGLPAAFVLATDAALALGARLCRAVSTFMDEPYVLVEDAWAWQIPRGSAGWPPHRGMSALLERPRPELLNTWVALSDASIDRSCMHFVRLDEDPNYPDTLASIDLGSPLTTRPAPLTAGEALVWNANILHWGGSCSLEAAGARVSCSFSLVRADALSAMGVRPLSTDLTPLERIDFVAGQIATYGDGQRDVSSGRRPRWRSASTSSSPVRKER